MNSDSENKYINSIDGLRALAVVAVMIFHMNSSFLPGGFTGVDIFFVISGYVVARSLAFKERTSMRIFIQEFYRRRLIRIYPALLVCLLVTSFVVIVFIPRFYVSKSIDETGLAAFFGFSNVILALDNESYFSLSTDFNTFVHTWSLGVEEQFYFIFPFVFYLWLSNKFKNLILYLFIISIFFSYFYLINDLNKAYYFITSRFWELAAGVMLFQYHHSDDSATNLGNFERQVILFSGMFITTVGLWFANKNQFPLPWALAPVIGTTLLLHGFASKSNSNSAIDRVFSMRVSTHLGKLSYSLYLWHWPVFTFFRWSVGLQTNLEYLLAILITYLLAFASYNLLEVKFPKFEFLRVQSSKKIIVLALLVVCFSASMTSFGYKKQTKLSLSVTSEKEVWSPYEPLILPSSGKSLSGRTLYVVGDSHAGAYTKMLNMLSDETGIEIKMYSEGGCGISNMLTPVLVEENSCSIKVKGWLREIFNEIGEDDIVFFATLKLPRSVYQSSTFPGDIVETMNSMNSTDSKVTMEAALEESLKVMTVLSEKKPLIILDAPKPIFNYIAFRCADWFTASNPICNSGYVESRLFLEKMRAPILKNMEELKVNVDKLVVWDPLPILCNAEDCSLYKDQKPIFFDSDHLSGFGNRLLYQYFKDEIFNYLGLESVHTIKSINER